MTAVSLDKATLPPREANAWQRLKVNRGWLSLWFMMPAAAFLILFLAYPLGLGNVAGAILGAVALVSLPELFRAAADYRMLIYGIALLLLIRYRPQGLMGTVCWRSCVLSSRMPGVTARTT